MLKQNDSGTFLLSREWAGRGYTPFVQGGVREGVGVRGGVQFLTRHNTRPYITLNVLLGLFLMREE